jgi:CubicO group peptidase (beta-lactamase class C family)
MSRITLCIFSIVFCSVLSCERFDDPSPNYTYTVPQSVPGEFSVSSLEAEGLDEALISQMSNRIIREEYKRINSLLILRNNKLVYENYFHGYSEGILQNTYSAAKSITAILTGIAIDKGFIDNVNARIMDLLPEYKNLENPDPRKKEITIEHLLNMSSGLDCEDWYQHTEGQMQASQDWVKFTLDLPMIHDPGSYGSYCTGGAVTLGRIIENESGLSLEEFANQYLFKPLGIAHYQWHLMPDGRPSGGGLFFLRPRDMAKIGQLMLNDGAWNGQRILSEEWVAQCSRNQIKLEGTFDGYGYLWWKQAFQNNTIETYFADGNGGQNIMVVPSQNMVLVLTGSNQNTSLALQNFDIINNYILSAIK